MQTEFVPVQAPPHPANVELLAAVAVRVTGVLISKTAVQVVPQLMPAGLLLTLPWHVPLIDTDSAGEALKLAVTEALCVNVTVHVEVPLQMPDHPPK